jgi:hypothetical protein
MFSSFRRRRRRRRRHHHHHHHHHQQQHFKIKFKTCNNKTTHRLARQALHTLCLTTERAHMRPKAVL